MKTISLTIATGMMFLLNSCALTLSPQEKARLRSELPSKQGTYTDARDGYTYQTIRVGNYTWFAENLRYASEGSFCYNDQESNCAKYGRLYSIQEILESRNKGELCPEGWRVPNDSMVTNLIVTAKGTNLFGFSVIYAGAYLNSVAGKGYEWNKERELLFFKGAQNQDNEYDPMIPGYFMTWVGAGHPIYDRVNPANAERFAIRCVKF